MFDLLFSFKGRIGRLQYFLTSMAIGLIVIVAVVGALFVPFSQAMSASGNDAQLSASNFSTPFLLIAFLLVGVGIWSQLALVWKRTRDMNHTMTFAHCYVGSLVLSAIPLIGLVFSAANTVMILILWFKPSKGDEYETVDPEVFGAQAHQASMSYEPATDVTTQMTDADLVARAAQLREAQSPPETTPADAPPQNTARAAPKSFGRRSRLQPG